MGDNRYLVEELEDYDEVFELAEGRSMRCSSKKQFKSKPNNEEQNFIGEYAKTDLNEGVDETLGAPIGEFESTKSSNSIFPLHSYKSHSRFIFAERGYVQCEGTQNYIVFLKNVIWSRMLSLFVVVLVFLTSFLLSYNLVGMNDNKTQAPKQSLGSGGELDFSNEEFDSPDTGMLVPIVKSIDIKGNKLLVDFENPEGSGNPYKMWIELEDGNRVYESEIIPVGGKPQNTESINISFLAPGVYQNALVAFEYYSEDSTTKLNTAYIKMPLVYSE
ncbi:MAG: hypothetical protein LBI55_03120 [Oscillospiraceae bacterium]|jgi:hypothetical protein|nr:hypothetical protein [Oscillospiraceae bacterium]